MKLRGNLTVDTRVIWMEALRFHDFERASVEGT